MKSFSFFVLIAALSFSFNASATNQQWVIHDEQPDARIRVRVIESDSSRSGVQGVISQDVVYDQIITPSEFSQFKAEQAPRRALVLPQAGQPLWVPTKSAWTPADEDAYSDWFATNATTDFLDGSGMSLDCADTGLMFRWVFARNNHLPMATTLSGSGQLFGHFSSNAAWDKLPTNADWKKDERFKAALHYLFENSYTRTVVADLAPTLINPQYVRPGSMFMVIRAHNGHTQSIQSVSPTAGITTIWGNEPASEKIYETPIMIEFDEKQTFGVWREPRLNAASQWELIPAAEMPGYSLEQFQQNFNDESEYTSWVDARLGVQQTHFERLNSMWTSLYIGLNQRLSVTAEGVFACFYKPCDPSSTDYSNYSTNSRDARLAHTQSQIIALVNQLGADDSDVQQWKAQLIYYPAVIFGTPLTAQSLSLDPSSMQNFNPDPRVSFATRWGLVDTSGSDPNFDFFMSSSMMTQLILDRAADVQQKMDSTQLDAEIRTLFGKAETDRHSSQFSAGSFQSVHDNLAIMKVYVPGTASCPDSTCTLNDLTWGSDGSSNQISLWSSKAADAPAARWGFAALVNKPTIVRQ